MATGLKLLGFVRRRRRWRGPLVRGWVHGHCVRCCSLFVRGLATLRRVSVHTAPSLRQSEPGEKKRKNTHGS